MSSAKGGEQLHTRRKIMTRFRRGTVLIFLSLLALQSLTFGQSKEGVLLKYSYTGSGKPGVSGREFMAAMKHREVQKVLLDLATAPLSQVFLDEALKGTGVTPGDLQALGLIRTDGDRYLLAFSLYTRADLDKIRAVAEVEGKTLAAALLAHRSEIEEILTRDPLPGVDWRAVAYFVLGCASLDWDGLNLTVEKGYRTVPKEGTYLPEALQPGGGGSVRGLYWGSHSMHAPIAFTSFGDHYSQPRNALPDLLWYLDLNAPEPLKSHLIDAADALIRRRAGMMMLALRDSDKNRMQLAAAAGVTEEEAEKLLTLLAQLNYIRVVDDRYRAIIPVLTERDAPMVKQLRRIGHEVMVEWFAKHHEILCQKLGDLTPVRYGVLLSDGFYRVWHYVFGIANRELVTEGLFANPYDPGRSFKGFIPAVYQLDVVQGPL